MNDLSRTFDEVVSIIETARSNAFRKVNEELILMYMNVGRFLSEKSKDASIETFVVSNGKAYKNVEESIIYPFFYTYLQVYFDDFVEFAIDENGNIVLIEDLPDNTVLYGYINDGIVYGYYTYDINIQDPIILNKSWIRKDHIS